MLWTQGLVAVGLLVMSVGGPHPGVAMQTGLLVFGAILTGVAAASQDVVIDAWRIEIADDADELGLLTSAYSIGFRLAIIATDALILVMAERFGWGWSYAAFALAMGVGVGATLWAKEPSRADAALQAAGRARPGAGAAYTRSWRSRSWPSSAATDGRRR